MEDNNPIECSKKIINSVCMCAHTTHVLSACVPPMICCIFVKSCDTFLWLLLRLFFVFIFLVHSAVRELWEIDEAGAGTEQRLSTRRFPLRLRIAFTRRSPILKAFPHLLTRSNLTTKGSAIGITISMIESIPNPCCQLVNLRRKRWLEGLLRNQGTKFSPPSVQDFLPDGFSYILFSRKRH